MLKPPLSRMPSSTDGKPSSIEQRYLLLTFIPYYVDRDGSVWLERLWHRDFVEHMRYLPRLTMAAPKYARHECERPENLVRVDVPPGVELNLVPLPHLESTPGALARLPLTAWTVWNAVGDADIVHSGVVGWPYPLGWVANPIAKLRNKRLVIVVESTPWRLSGSSEDNFRRRARAGITELLARWSANRADLCLFTQPGYRKSLFTNGVGTAHVTPATWVNEEDVLDRETVEKAWSMKPNRLRLLFAGRLTPDKGVNVLLDAMQRLHERDVAVDLDIIGEGPLADRCRKLADGRGKGRVRLLAPVEYGKPFFRLLQGYHAVVIPTLSEEQPRILFDAYSQGVPVIATDTDGHAPYVLEGETGWLIPRHDPAALADAIQRASNEPDQLQRMGTESVKLAQKMTHREMHEVRRRILADCFGTAAAKARGRTHRVQAPPRAPSPF